MEMTSDYRKANAYTLKCMCVSSIVMIVAWTLNILKIFIIDQTIMNHSLIGVFVFIVCGFLVKFTLGFERPVSNYLMLFLFVGMITFVNMQLSYHVTLFMPFPMVCAVLYGRKKYARYTFALISFGLLGSVLVGFQIGLCDANMLLLTTSTKANETARLAAGTFDFNSNQVFLVLFFVVPRVMAFWAFTAVLNYIMKSIQEKTLHEQESLRLAESERLANQAKSRFLAQMSHEIRTPINTVLGMNEMILHKAKDEEILDYSHNIKKSGKNLLMLINSILDFSRIEDGKMELLPVNYNMSDLIEGLRISVEQRAKDKGLDFVISADKDLPRELFGDDLRISQVIINLLTNAVKYTKDGSVTLDIREESRKDDQIKIFVQVKDTGIGIREEDLPKLFTSFERLEENKNRTIEGTGLGLSICTRLLEMMGSKLEVRSTYGEGSCFYFYLVQKIIDSTPMSETAAFAVDEKSSDRAAGVIYPDAKILVVDDNGMNLKVIRNLLGLFQITPDAESSGAGAIKRMREHDYDIVFMDHMMPEMDGIETLAKLRKENLVPEHTSVIALTANAIVGARKLYMDASFDDYLTKPIELGQLSAALDKYLPEEKKRSPDFKEEDEVIEFEPEDFSGRDPEDDGNGEERTAIALEQARKIGLDTRTGLIYCGNDEAFYLDMLREFVSSCPEKEEKLEGCFAREDWNNYKIYVHALKSNLASIGSAELSEMARELEEAAKHQDASVLKEKHGTLLSRYRQLVSELRNKVV